MSTSTKSESTTVQVNIWSARLSYILYRLGIWIWSLTTNCRSGSWHIANIIIRPWIELDHEYPMFPGEYWKFILGTLATKVLLLFMRFFGAPENSKRRACAFFVYMHVCIRLQSDYEKVVSKRKRIAILAMDA